MKVLTLTGLMFLLVSCSFIPEYVALEEDAHNSEVISQSYIRGSRAKRCKKIDDFEVVKLPNQRPDHKRYSVTEIKARNAADKHDATHLLLWPTEEFKCDSEGNESSESDDVCVRQPVTAYRCMIGRGT